MEHLLQWGLESATTILTGVVTIVLLPMLVRYITARIENEKLKLLVEDLGITVSTSVAEYGQTVVGQLKADNRFDTKAQKKILEEVTNNVINNLTSKSKAYIAENKLDIQELVIRYIETEIYNRKNQVITDELISA